MDKDTIFCCVEGNECFSRDCVGVEVYVQLYRLGVSGKCARAFDGPGFWGPVGQYSAGKFFLVKVATLEPAGEFYSPSWN